MLLLTQNHWVKARGIETLQGACFITSDLTQRNQIVSILASRQVNCPTPEISEGWAEWLKSAGSLSNVSGFAIESWPASGGYIKNSD